MCGLNGTYCIFKQFLIIVGLIVRLLTYAGYRNRYDQEKAQAQSSNLNRAVSAGHFKTLIGQYTGHFGTKVRNTDTYRIQIWILYPYICHLYPNWLATLAKNLASLAIGQQTQS